MNLEISIVIRKDIVPEIKIIIKIKIKIFPFKVMSWFIATAAPVLVFWIV